MITIINNRKVTHLHVHSTGSRHDGFGTPKQRAQRAVEIGCTALAITDHGIMCMNEKHHLECIEQGIKPISGCEIYYMDEFQPGDEYKHLRRHMTLLAKNLIGYQNLCRMQTYANLHQFHRYPIVDKKLLTRHHEGIICLSGCVLGEVPHYLIQGDYDTAKRKSEEFLSIFGDRFYFEVQPQNFDEQKRANEGLIKLSQQLGRPCVMTNDAHYPDNRDLESYILFRRMGRNDLDEVRSSTEEEKEEKRSKVDQIRDQYKELYICTGDRMAERWEELMGTNGDAYIEETNKIADRCEEYKLVFEERVPDYILYDEKGEKIKPLREVARRCIESMHKRGLDKNKLYIERVKKELQTISKLGSKVDYFLHVADMIDFAKAHDVAVGPGRGSGVASLIAYLLGIIQVDPVAFDLLFERFMHEERLTIPDYDVDFSSKNYGLVIEWLENKYPGRVAQVANILYYEGDNLINSVCKALSMCQDDIDTMKTVIGKLGFKENQPELSAMLYNKKLLDIEQRTGAITHFCKIWGNLNAFGQHASGVAFTPTPIDDYMPLMARGSAKERKVNTGYDMKALTRMNIVKIDVLRLKSLDILYSALKDITVDIHGVPLKEGQRFVVEDIPLDDKKVFEEYCKLNLVGIFQFDTPGGKEIISQVQPESIYELMDATSLDRPGALQMNQTRVYIEGKHGKVDTESVLYPFCKRTYGALMYQEQVMFACRAVGMSWGKASKVMKHLVALPSDHPLTVEFVTGAMKNLGLDEKKAQELFFNLTSYTFNMGHAAAYALLSYWMMWVKVHHPRLFFLHLLRENLGEKNTKKLEADAVINKIPIILPHVNGGSNYELYYKMNGGVAIQSGLANIDNCGLKAAVFIEQERKAHGDFKDLKDFHERVTSKRGPGFRNPVTTRVVEVLTNDGALEFDEKKFMARTLAYNQTLHALGSTQLKKRRYHHASK